MRRFFNRWTVTVFGLIVIIGVGTGVIAARYEATTPVTFSFEPPTSVSGSIYIDGDVAAPGWYPFGPNDSIDALVSAAGGKAETANLTLLIGETSGEQKIDINRAGVWLLEALPGIGTERAQAIIVYREHDGPFRDVDELTKVEGIGPGLLDDIRDLVTVWE